MKTVTAIILAGGSAARLLPLSARKPKSFLPFMGKPLINYLLRDLIKYEINDIIISTSPLSDKEILFLKKYSVKIHNSSLWSGTVGGITEVLRTFKNKVSDPFLVIYGDSLLEVNYKEFLSNHLEDKTKATILFHRPIFENFLFEFHGQLINDEKRTSYGIMDIDSQNYIKKFVEKPTIQSINTEFSNPVANAAVYILDKEIFEHITGNQIRDFAKDFFPQMIKRKMYIRGFNIGTGYRYDLGTTYNYYSLQLAILMKKFNFEIDYAHVDNALWMGESEDQFTNSQIVQPALICNNVKLAGSKIENSIIGNNVEVGQQTQIKNSIIFDNVSIGEKVSVLNSIIGEYAYIGHNTIIPPFSIIGDYCRFNNPKIFFNKDSIL